MQAPDRGIAGLPASLGQLRQSLPKPEVAAAPVDPTPDLDRGPALLPQKGLPFEIRWAVGLQTWGSELRNSGG